MGYTRWRKLGTGEYRMTQEELDAIPELKKNIVLAMHPTHPFKVWDHRGTPWMIGLDRGVLVKKKWGHTYGLKVPVEKNGKRYLADVDSGEMEEILMEENEVGEYSEINEVGDYIVRWRKQWGFYTPISLVTEKERDLMLGKLMLVCSEVGEAAEAVRHADFENFKEEIADTVIRLLDIARSCGIDLSDVINKKMQYNYTRPKGHGKLCSI